MEYRPWVPFAVVGQGLGLGDLGLHAMSVLFRSFLVCGVDVGGMITWGPWSGGMSVGVLTVPQPPRWTGVSFLIAPQVRFGNAFGGNQF